MDGFRNKDAVGRMAVVFAVVSLALAGAAEMPSPEDPGHLVYPGVRSQRIRADLEGGVALWAGVSQITVEDLDTGAARWTVPVRRGVDDQKLPLGGSEVGRRRTLVWAAEGEVSLRDNGSGKELWGRRPGFFGGARLVHAALSPDGEWVTLHYLDKTVELWRVASGERFRVTLPSGKSFWFRWMADGKTAVLAESLLEGNPPNSRLRLWLWEPGSADPVQGGVYETERSAWVEGGLPDGNLLVTEFERDSPEQDFYRVIVNPRTGERVREIAVPRETSRQLLTTEDNARLVAFQEGSPTARVTDLVAGTLLFEASLTGGARIPSHCFHSAGKDWVVCQDGRNALWLVPVEEGGAPRRILGDKRFLPSHVSGIRPPHLLCNESADDGRRIHTLLDMDSLEERARWQCGVSAQFWGTWTLLSAESGRLLLGAVGREGEQSKHALVLMASGAETPLLEMPYSPVALSPDGKWLVASGDDESLFLLDETGRTAASYVPQERQGTGAAVFSPDSRRVAVFHMPHLTVTDLAGGFAARELAGQPGVERMYLYKEDALCFSPDGRLLLAGATRGRAYLFDADSGRLLHTFVEERRFLRRDMQHQGDFLTSLGVVAMDLLGSVTDRRKPTPYLTCGFANNGTLALTIADDQLLRAWSVHDGRLVRTVDPKLPEERDTNGRINNQIVLSPNGNYCLARNWNGFGTASLWDTVGGQRLAEYRFPEGNRLGAVAVADDGKTVYAMIDFDLHFLPGRK